MPGIYIYIYTKVDLETSKKDPLDTSICKGQPKHQVQTQREHFKPKVAKCSHCCIGPLQQSTEGGERGEDSGI